MRAKQKEATAQKDTTDETATKQKLYTVKCKLNTDVSYSWNRPINRETENNNALNKYNPLFMETIQEKDSSLTNGRAIKQLICNTLGVAWNEDFDYFSDTARETKSETVAHADKTEANINTFVYKLQKSGKNDREILIEMLNVGYTKEQIKTAFKKDSEREAEKIKATKEAEELIKELNL